MKNELPKNWVIDTQAEKDSPLMSKFKNWFYEISNQDNLFIFKYYGMKEGKCFCSDNACFQLITLEQWNAFYFPEWEPKQGELIMVRDYDNEIWEEKTFVVFYNEKYFVEKDSEVLLGYNQAKPLPKESILQPLVDQLKAEAKKLGIEKVNITFE